LVDRQPNRTEGRREGDQFGQRERTQAVAELARSSDDQSVQLIGGLRPSLHR
jgi:hypothetical protein